MLKTTLVATTLLVAFGAATAQAGYDRAGHARDGVSLAGYAHKHGPRHYGKRHRPHKQPYYGYRYGVPYGHPGWRHWQRPPGWYGYRGRPWCSSEVRKSPVDVIGKRGNYHRKWVWTNVRVCA